MSPSADRSVLFLVAGAGPSVRYRVLQYLPRLRARGVRADVADLHVPLARRWALLRRAAGYRAVVVHRVLLAPLEARLLRRGAPSTVFDFDDAILFRDSTARRFESWQRRARFARMVGGARAVVAGNEYLAGLARRYNDRVCVVPTAVDPSLYPLDRGETEEPVLVWIGTRVNLIYLRPLLPALARVRTPRGPVRLKIVCDGFVDAPDLAILRRPWSSDTEAEELASAQVGIMPLPDDPWTRGKCALKILQYFAAGLPVVCSPVGANTTVVEDGRSGFFARDDDEWVRRLEELLGDPAKRRAFGAAGRERVERDYATDVVFERLLQALEA